MKSKNLLEFGIINIDKPSGPTSFQVSEKVKNLLGLRKTSHFGTLDPKVTGVLPVALNRACKLTGFFLGEDKEYLGIMRLHEEVSKEKIEKAIKENFTGVITQKPPVKSRVKRVERQREVKVFEILEQDEKDFLFRAVVEGGTYIRKLIDDLGKNLGVGAHMLELRRSRAGIFSEDDKDHPAVTLYELEKAIEEDKLEKIIIPAQEAIKKIYPIAEIKKEFVEKVLHGSPIKKDFLKEIPEKTGVGNRIGVFCEDNFIGVFKIIDEGDNFAKSEFTLQPI